MSRWTRDPNDIGGGPVIDLDLPPRSGGGVAQCILGLFLAGLFFTYAIWISFTGRAYLLEHDNQGRWVEGPSAYAIATTFAGAAIFFHGRWFWGLVSDRYHTFRILSILGLLLTVGGMIATLGFVWF